MKKISYAMSAAVLFLAPSGIKGVSESGRLGSAVLGGLGGAAGACWFVNNVGGLPYYLRPQTKAGVMAACGTLTAYLVYRSLEGQTPEARLTELETRAELILANELLQRFATNQSLARREEFLRSLNSADAAQLSRKVGHAQSELRAALQLVRLVEDEATSREMKNRCDDIRRDLKRMSAIVHEASDFVEFITAYHSFSTLTREIMSLTDGDLRLKALELYPQSEWSLVLFKQKLARRCQELDGIIRRIASLSSSAEVLSVAHRGALLADAQQLRLRIIAALDAAVENYKYEYERQYALCEANEKRIAQELEARRKQEAEELARREEADRQHALEAQRLKLEQERLALERQKLQDMREREERREARKERENIRDNETERDKNRRKYDNNPHHGRRH